MPKRILLAIGLAWSLCAPVSAQIYNGDFEIFPPDLDGWTQEEAATNLVTRVDEGPPLGSIAQIETLANGTFFGRTAAELDDAFDVAAGTTGALADTPTNTFVGLGSGLWQDFNAVAGDQVNFVYNFSFDTLGRDAAFFTIVFNPNDAMGMDGTLVASGVAPDTATVYTVVNAYTVAATGTYRIGFGVLGNGTNSTNANNATSNLQISLVGLNIPEIDARGAGMPLAVLGMLFLVAFDGRRRASHVVSVSR